jgi:hypothetical protein
MESAERRGSHHAVRQDFPIPAAAVVISPPGIERRCRRCSPGAIGGRLSRAGAEVAERMPRCGSVLPVQGTLGVGKLVEQQVRDAEQVANLRTATIRIATTVPVG